MKKSICILVVGIGVILFGCGIVLADEGTSTDKSNIEPQKVSIIGKDKSVLEDEEEDVIMKPLPNIEPPAYTMEKVKPPQIEPKPVLPKVEAIKKPSFKEEEKTLKPTLYSFGMAYGSKELLLYDFTHTNETKDVGYYFRIDRNRSDGFSWNDHSSFQKVSQDYLCGNTLVNFQKWSLRTEVDYLNKDVTLPYQNELVENKLKKSIALSYEVKVQPESKLSLSLDIGKGDIYSGTATGIVKNNALGLHLGFDTPFKKGNPPLSIGTKIYQEKLEGRGIDRTLRFYSLYAEGKRFKITPPLLLDVKVSLDDYKNSSSQLDFLLKLHYSKKENLLILGSIERGLSLPTFDELYIDADYRGINSAVVEPEKSWKYKVSGDYRVSDELFLEGAVFTQQIENYIVWSGGSPTYVYQPQNIGKATLSGLDLGLRYFFNPKLSQNVTYSSVNAKNKSDGVIPNIPDNKLVIGLRYKDGEKLTINMQGEYAGEAYAGTNSAMSKLPSYFLVNITGEKRINENLFYSFSCENLFGDKYEYLSGYPGQQCRFAVGVRLKF
ncbi:MAG: TonB-dependent receptor [Nitrospirota bacterium]